MCNRQDVEWFSAIGHLSKISPFNVPRADRHCTNCDKSVMGDDIHFLYECTKLNNLIVKYLFSPDIRREPNVFHFVNIMQTNDPETIGNLAKSILHGLKLYT